MKIGGYHIILVPKDPQKTKRWHLSSFTARLFALGALLAIPFVMGSLFATAHLQNKLITIKRTMAEDNQILEQKEIFASRLAVLERALAKTEQSLGSLERALDADLGEIQGGLGPIEKGDIILNGKLEEMPKAEAKVDHFFGRSDHINLTTLRSKINRLGDRVSGMNAKIKEVYELNADKIRFMNSSPSLIPVNGWVTSDFGGRRSPYSGIYKMHYGVDIASPTGTSVRAPSDGKVLFAETKGGYGRMVVIDHGYGITTLFGHASKLLVKQGQKVKRGDEIALVGSTGYSTGPHVHYEVHVDGIPTNPLNFVIE